MQHALERQLYPRGYTCACAACLARSLVRALTKVPVDQLQRKATPLITQNHEASDTRAIHPLDTKSYMKSTIADFTFAIELLEALIGDDPPKSTTLVICSTRKAFLRQIAPTILTPQVQEVPASQDGPDEDEAPQEPLQHRFLIPTLGLLASARALKLAFCPSVKSLRAYLSTYTAPTEPSCAHESDNMRSLIVVDLVLLHRDTSEFSVQGLSRTLACAVEAAARNGEDLRLVECKDLHDAHDLSRGYGLWSAQVPLLSGSVRLGGDGVNWAGRAISVRTVASTWLGFEKRRSEPPTDVVEPENEEMLV